MEHIKEYECKMDVESKRIHISGIDYEIHTGRLYKATHPAVVNFPNLFKEKVCVIEEVKQDINEVFEDIQDTVEDFITDDKPTKKDANERTNVSEVQTEKTRNYGRIILLIMSIIAIVSISVYLRTHGISEMFEIPLEYAVGVVLAFILSEFAIANIMLAEIKSKVHKAFNFIILGAIQFILIAIAFTFEFGALSNILVKQENQLEMVDKRESILKDNIKEYEEQITTIQKQIDMTSDKSTWEKKRLMNRMIKYTNMKREANNELKEFYSSIEQDVTVSDRTSLENTSKVFGVERDTLMKSIVFALAGILNVLYLAFMYSFVWEFKRRKEGN